MKDKQRIVFAVTVGATISLVMGLLARLAEPSLWWLPYLAGLATGPLCAYFAHDLKEVWDCAKQLWVRIEADKPRADAFFWTMAFVLSQITIIAFVITRQATLEGNIYLDFRDSSIIMWGLYIVCVLSFTLVGYPFIRWLTMLGAIDQGYYWNQDYANHARRETKREKYDEAINQASLAEFNSRKLFGWFARGFYLIIRTGLYYGLLVSALYILYGLVWAVVQIVFSLLKLAVLTVCSPFYFILALIILVYNRKRLTCAVATAMGFVFSWLYISPLATNAWGSLFLIVSGTGISLLIALTLDWTANYCCDDLVPEDIELSW